MYHGCGNSYLDGTNMFIKTGRKCLLPTNEPFWKNPNDTCNKIAKSTRNQLKSKARASPNYMKRYFKFLKNYHKNNYFSGDYSTDTESGTSISDHESLTNNASETEQNLSDNELTGENFITDEKTEENQTPKNKETNDKMLPVDI